MAWATWCYRSWTSLGSLMYRAHLARWHRHEGPTAAGLRRPPQPAQGLVVARSPSKQLYFATYFQPRSSRYGRAFLARRHRPEPLQAAVLHHLPQPAPGLSLWSGFPREEAPPGGPPSSCTSPPTSTSPGTLATAGLSSRGGTARSPSKQLYFATYISQPRGSRFDRAFATYLSQRGGTKNPMAQDWHGS